MLDSSNGKENNINFEISIKKVETVKFTMNDGLCVYVHVWHYMPGRYYFYI